MSSQQKSLTVLVTGDFCPQKTVESLSMEGRFDAIYGDILAQLRDKDLSITNLECPLTLASAASEKIGPSLRAHPVCAQAVRFGGFGVATLANNHIMDYGVQGLRDTIQNLSGAGVKSVGAGVDLMAASAVLYVDCNGSSVAIVNMAESEFGMASEGCPGASPMDPVTAHYRMREARKEAESVLVFLHGGAEQHPYPTPRMLRFARYMADLGASAVFVHHSHCLAGYESWNGVPIFHGLGDFLFEWPELGSVPRESVFIRLTLSGGRARTAKILPFYHRAGETLIRAMDESTKQKLLARIEQLGEPLRNPHVLAARTQSLVERRTPDTLAALLLLGRFGKTLLSAGALDRMLQKRRSRILLLMNLIRCETHRDVVLEVLQRLLDSRR